MNARPLLAALALFGCQAGQATSSEPPAPLPGRAEPVVLPVRAAITPMQKIATEPTAAREVAPPWTLTASDGSGLVLTRVDAKAVVQGPLAFTELHLYFHNAEARTREGTFAITLPSGAAVSRFAMETDGQLQEAEVVEKAFARRIYDDFLHRKQDPALLEKAAGNQFTAKVFPIAATSNKHLVLSFSHELAGRGYTLPLRGLPKTERVDVQLVANALDGTPTTQALSERDWQPDRDFVATVPASAAAVTSGALVVGALAFADARGTFAAPEVPDQLTLLVDTSASRALGFAGYVRSIHDLVDALRTRYGDQIQLRVVAFDQDSQPIFDGLAADYGAAHDAALIARGAAGASNLGQVIATLAAPGVAHRRVVIVTDGVVTAGPDTPALVAAIKRLPIDRLDVVLAGGIRDERLAAAIVRAGLPKPGDVHDLDRGIQTVATGLGEPVLVDVAIEVPGATWVYPKQLPAARPGSTLMVFARMAKPTQAIDIVIGGRRRTIGLGTATPALVERAVAGAEIEELETTLASTTEPATAKALRDDIAKRSVRARVISSQTSMLVLESEADYARYRIERTTRSDILVIGPRGLEQTRRSVFLASNDRPPSGSRDGLEEAHAGRRDPDRNHTDREAAIESARSAGVLGSSAGDGGAFAGLTGTANISSGFSDTNSHGGLLGNEAGEINGGFGFGHSGFGPGGGGNGTLGTGTGTGAGYGIGAGGGQGGMRGRTSAVPTVSIGPALAQGSLDRAIIRRYIKRNIQRIQYCYEKALLAQPGLAGTLTVQFLISHTGVPIHLSTAGLDREVATCVAGVIASIDFPPPPGGSSVQVSYPFTMSPSGGSALPSSPAPDAGVFRTHTIAPRGRRSAPEPVRAPPPEPEPDNEENRGGPPLTGKLADVMQALRGGSSTTALAIAKKWHGEAPGDVLALIALGESLEATKQVAAASRIYGSIIDLYPTRADFRRFAGERLERLGAPSRELVIDTYRRAVADRPDHVTGHRLLAYALVRNADLAGGFAAILAGLDHTYPGGRFLGAERILREDAGMIAAALIASGGKREDVMAELTKRSLGLIEQPSTRFIMYWETDANDVDFHIRDSRGGHAWYSKMNLPSGGDLYADVTTGYGPECFAIQGTPKAGPYRLSINYYSQGPMGYGMGLLQIQTFDGKKLTFDDRPYVIMRDHAFVDLGTYR